MLETFIARHRARFTRARLEGRSSAPAFMVFRAFFGVAVALIFFLTFHVSSVFSQEIVGIRLGPSIIEEKVEPGQVFSSILNATNVSDKPQTFYVIKRDIHGLEDEGWPIFAEEGEATGFEISSWVQIPSGPFVIAPGETKAIPFSIIVPKNVSPGGHVGAVFLSKIAERPKESGVGFGYRVATIINFRVAGDVLEEAWIREFRADKSIYSRPKVTFIARIENLGNTVIKPRGPLEITDMFGKKAATLRVNDAGGAIFPKSVRRFETSWQGEGLAFGRYQVVMSLVYGEESRKTITSLLSFWILPLHIIIPILGGLLLLILVIVFSVKLHIRGKIRELRRATEESIHQSRLGSLERELFHSRDRGAPLTKLAAVAIVLLVFTLIFLIILFFLFA